MKLLIKQGRLVDPVGGIGGVMDVLLEDGRYYAGGDGVVSDRRNTGTSEWEKLGRDLRESWDKLMDGAEDAGNQLEQDARDVGKKTEKDARELAGQAGR